MQARFYGATHEGAKRPHNEDSFFANPKLGLWIVADGMGGHAAGEVASQIVVDFIYHQVAQGVSIEDAVEAAHDIVLRRAEQGIGSPGMGSTVVACRAYLWDAGCLRQLTRDHSLVQQLIDAGKIGKGDVLNHPYRNVVTQALGAADLEQVEAEKIQGELYRDQQILLCTDGLTAEISDADIEKVLSQPVDEQTKVDELIRKALEHGGSDNITVLLVSAPETAPEKPCGEAPLQAKLGKV
jgi:serine/threonine protein phosphatase PrpC